MFCLLCLFCAIIAFVQAIPLSDGEATAALPLLRKRSMRTPQQYHRQAEALRNKYARPASTPKSRRRSTTTGSLSFTSEEDSEYFAQVEVGTPSQSFNLILDTGSADLVLATSPCTGCSASTSLYEPSSSSTSTDLETHFSITYGSGDASGSLYTDSVSIAGYTVSSQTLAACTVVDNLLDGSISGLLGLGWQGLAQSGAVPLVEALANDGSLSDKVFGFSFVLYDSLSTVEETAYGGQMTIGYLNSSAYSGDINWVDMSSPDTYWQIPLSGVSVDGQSLSLTSEAAVIDTGTTLIGAPSSAVEAIYAQVSGAEAITLSGVTGYYTIPCSWTGSVSFTFGGVEYSMTESTFIAGYADTSGSTCLGAIFESGSDSSVEWIFGDAFLQNVYAAFRFSSPAAVGFASKSDGSSSSSSSSSSTASESSSTTSSVANAATSIALPQRTTTILTLILASMAMAACLVALVCAADFKVPLKRRRTSFATFSSTLIKRDSSKGIESLVLLNGDEFYGTISIGTPPQSFDVVIDSGSADLIVAESPCTGCDNITRFYNPTDSSTSATNQGQFSITYGSGSANGTLYNDRVSIANYSLSGQTFAACTSFDNIIFGELDGLLGIGRQTLSHSGAVPLLQGLANSGQLSQPVVGISLAFYTGVSQAIATTLPGGEMTIGYLNSSGFSSGTLNWISVSPTSNFWTVPLEGINVDGSDVGISTDRVVIDTGTTLIGAYGGAVTAIYAKIPGSRQESINGTNAYWTIPCDWSGTIEFGISGQKYPMNVTSFAAGFFDSNGTRCVGAVFEIVNDSTNTIVLGASFLQTVYLAFNYSDAAPAIGLALPPNGSSNGTAAASKPSASSTTSIGTVLAILPILFSCSLLLL